MIEMLVVIGILVLLAGLLLPAVIKALHFAEKAHVYEDLHELETVWTAYLADYRSFPDIEVHEMNTNAVSLLSGDTNVFNNANFLAKRYMEFTREQRANGFLDYYGVKAGGGPGNAKYLYQVALDSGLGDHDTTDKYDGEVTPYPGTVVTKSVVVWSRGKDGRDETEDDRKDDVRVW